MTEPFFKWTGTKRRLSSQILAHFPRSFRAYHEPFVGGGALFFALAPTGAAHLSDLNPDLVCAYRAVRDDVDGLADRLAAITFSREEYARIQALDPTLLPLLDRAVRFLFLTKTSFNGLWRVNRDGQHNCPVGDKTTMRLCDRKTLVAASRALAGATIDLVDFTAVAGRAEPGDLVYLDPPYVPLSQTASFTAYTKEGFDDADQVKLATLVRTLHARGVFVVQSNSSADRVRELYDGFELHEITASRTGAADGAKRAPVTELVIVAKPDAWEERAA